ncbi:MAG: hypothetical protein HQ478_01410 [Chloroflexi bacterium]|nr:hypothetical protein [Chloroflexota bacterium]
MKKYLAVLLAVVALMTVAIGGVSVARADGDGPSVRNRVAEILGISPDDLDAAVAQAHDEAKTEHRAERLAAAVESGTITQDEVDAIQAWFDGKPEALSKVRQMGLRHAVHADETESFLAGLVTDGIITQAEADEILSWFNARPESIEKIRPNHDSDSNHFRGHGRHRGGHGFGGRWHGGGRGGHGGGFQAPAPSDVNNTNT